MKVIDIDGQPIRNSGKYEEYLYGNDYSVKLFRKGVDERYVRLFIERHRIVSNISIPTLENMEIVRERKLNRIGVLSPYLKGQTLQEKYLKTPTAIFKSMDTFVTQHKFIHGQESSGLLPLQKDKLREKIINNKVLVSQQKKRLLNLLNQLPDERALCHGTYSPAKILLSDDGIKLLDWRSGTCGSPVADVALTYVSLKFAWGAHGKWALLRRLFCRFHSWLYLTQYQKLSDLDFGLFKHWLLISVAVKLTDAPKNVAYINYVQKHLKH